MISLTLSLIAVFIPLLFMTGLVGRMFREFALTLTIAVVVSAIVSLTLTPMMCGAPAAPTEQAHGRLAAGRERFNGLIDRTVAGYHRSLLWVLRRQFGDADGDAGHARRHDLALRRRCPRASCRCRTPA